MAAQTLRIGTRDSQLAVWQATLVQNLLKEAGIASELVYIKSEGDIDTITPLYDLGVTGVFTKTLDAALLNKRIDIAVHSMKDVPTKLAEGIQQAAVLKRASHKDILVYKNEQDLEAIGFVNGEWNEGEIVKRETSNVKGCDQHSPFTIGTSSVRRIAQWLHRYPTNKVENLRGNVNTRLRKLEESNWQGAIFAAAGLERINLRPEHSINLDWMLPAPSQGAIMVVCREGDHQAFDACQPFNDEATALCTKIEKDFLRVLMGGCTTPISGLAVKKGETIQFNGNICAPDGSDLVSIEIIKEVKDSANVGEEAGKTLLLDARTQHIIETVRNGKQ
ncbi:hydroxymethylbilane synthase [Flavisolibacter tropicus]|uniref:Porphobilinogen deaminase n=1 Tax=Flavisolibacter tropicus TaxID=1492898 RepID=A0A172TVR3_9BACT|nr:hydroxymethylbilane synthase [Flavisolibacter tropicus]ANE51130.1 porphobilinogen deaminase [Flavisolibacter tropicus]